MSIAVTNLWVFNFQTAVQNGDYRAARCILDNQLVGRPKLNWRCYVTAEQAAAIEKTIIDVIVAPEPSYSVPTKAKAKRKAKGDDVIVTITAGDQKLVMTGGELEAAGRAIRQETRKRKRGA
jgi:hypothetical protein